MLLSDAPQANVTTTTERHTLEARVDRAYVWGPRLAAGDHDARARRVPRARAGHCVAAK